MIQASAPTALETARAAADELTLAMADEGLRALVLSADAATLSHWFRRSPTTTESSVAQSAPTGKPVRPASLASSAV